MAEFSSLPAMAIDPVGIGLKNSLAMSQAQEAITAQQQQSQLAPLELKSAQQHSALETADYGNQTLAQVAKDAAAADPEDAPVVWDEGMRKAASAGVTTANQYIGHYRPDLAERVGDVYGGAGVGSAKGANNPLAPTQADMVAIQRAVAQIPQPQAVKALSNLNKAITSFNNVKDQPTWDAEMQALKESGIDVSQFLPNMDWNPVNYATAYRQIQKLVPYRDALMERQAITSMGGVAPVTTPLYQPDVSISGYTKDGKPVYYDKHNPGSEFTGSTIVGPKPSAAISTFLMKQQAWLAVHPGDQPGALEFANGKRSMSPQQLQLEALNQANKQLGEASLAGEVIEDPDAWVREKTMENYKLLSGATSPGAGPGSSGGAAPGGLPARAIQALKAAGGKPLKFNNGQTWKIGPNGQPQRVQ